MKYRVSLRRESEQVVEFDDTEMEEGDTVATAASELADPGCWFSDGDEIDAIAMSEDDGASWRQLPISEVLRLEAAGR